MNIHSEVFVDTNGRVVVSKNTTSDGVNYATIEFEDGGNRSTLFFNSIQDLIAVILELVLLAKEVRDTPETSSRRTLE